MVIQNVPSERTSLSKRKIRQIGLLLLLTFPLLSQVASAAQVSLAWNPSPSPYAVGYMVYYGTASRTYGASLDVGNVTTYTLTGLTPGQAYFIALTAYNQFGSEGDFSNEVMSYRPISSGLCTVQGGWYTSIQSAYNEAVNGDTIQCQEALFDEDLAVNRDITVTLAGGYDAEFTSNAGGKTTLKGMITTPKGKITIRNFGLSK